MYRVSFVDWRYRERQISYSPYYKTKEDCKNFISAMLSLSNHHDYTNFDIHYYEPKYFSEKDIDIFKKK